MTGIQSIQECSEYMNRELKCDLNYKENRYTSSRLILCEHSTCKPHLTRPILFTISEIQNIQFLQFLFIGGGGGGGAVPLPTPSIVRNNSSVDLESYYLLCVYNMETKIFINLGCMQCKYLIQKPSSKIIQFKKYTGYMIDLKYIHPWIKIDAKRSKQLLAGAGTVVPSNAGTVVPCNPTENNNNAWTVVPCNPTNNGDQWDLKGLCPFMFYLTTPKIPNNFKSQELMYILKLRLLLLQGYLFKNNNSILKSYSWTLLQSNSISQLLWSNLEKIDIQALRELLLLSSPIYILYDHISFVTLRILVKLSSSRLIYDSWHNIELALLQWRYQNLNAIEIQFQQLFYSNYKEETIVIDPNVHSLLFQEKMKYLQSDSKQGVGTAVLTTAVLTLTLTDWIKYGDQQDGRFIIDHGKVITHLEIVKNLYWRKIIHNIFEMEDAILYSNFPIKIWSIYNNILSMSISNLFNSFIFGESIIKLNKKKNTKSNHRVMLHSKEMNELIPSSLSSNVRVHERWPGAEDKTLSARVQLNSEIWYQSAAPCLLLAQHQCSTNTVHLDYNLRKLLSSVYSRLGYSYAQAEEQVFLSGRRENQVVINNKKQRLNNAGTAVPCNPAINGSDQGGWKGHSPSSSPSVSREQLNELKMRMDPNKEPIRLGCNKVKEYGYCLFSTNNKITEKEKNPIQIVSKMAGITDPYIPIVDIEDLGNQEQHITDCRRYFKWRFNKLKQNNNTNDATQQLFSTQIYKVTLLSIQQQENYRIRN